MVISSFEYPKVLDLVISDDVRNLDIWSERRAERVGRTIPTNNKELECCLERIENEKRKMGKDGCE